MSSNLNVLPADGLADTSGGGIVWHRLHSEREEICETLLKDCAPRYEAKAAEPRLNERALNAADWHRAMLEARLLKVDDALDRLVSGSYGNCCKCGKWIEDTKLEFDPAIAYCLTCWDRLQTIY